jgi:Flp pilus assembly protein TadG
MRRIDLLAAVRAACTSLSGRLAQVVQAARRDSRGVAAVEFAIILPLMLMMYIGTLDVTRGVMSSRKVGIVSRTVSDLVSQQSTGSAVTSTTLASFFAAASAIMSPYSTTNLTITVSSVAVAAKSGGLCCDATVKWSYTQGGTLRPCGVKLTQVASGTPPAATNIQQSLITSNVQAGFVYTSTNTTSLIVADVTYTYAPFFPLAVPWFAGGVAKTTYMVPRAASGQITLASPITAIAGQSGAICS